MSTYLGRSINECGDIKKCMLVKDAEGNYTQYTSYVPKSIRAVFKNDRLIWPKVSKFKFWISLDPTATKKDYSNIIIHVKAGWQKNPTDKPTSEPHPITVYVKSSYRSGRVKCPYYVTTPSDWVTIENTTDKEATINPYEQEIPDNVPYDSKFTVYIKNNIHSLDRTTFLTIYQVDPLTGLPTDMGGDQDEAMHITVIQDGDEQFSNAEFSDNVANVTWYEDSNFNVPCIVYGDNKGNGASTTNGYTKLYCIVTGKSFMWSGTTKTVYFGENGEYLDSSSFISEFAENVFNVSYYGSGKWTATIKWKDNLPSQSARKITISNKSLSPSDTINYSGGTVTVSFDLNVTGIASARNMPVTLQIPSSEKWLGNARLEGTLSCWQNEGQVSIPIIDANPTITPDINAKKWVTSNSPIISNSNNYSQSFKISPTPVKSKSYIESEEIYEGKEKVTYIKSTTTSITLAFKIWRNDETYEERKCTFTIAYSGISSPLVLTQKATSIGESYEVTKYNYPEILKNNEIKVALNGIDAAFITSISQVYIKASKWRVDIGLKENGHKTIEPCIKNILLDKSFLESSNQNLNLQFEIISGEVNSERRFQTLSITCTRIYLDDETTLIQQGTGDAVPTKYHDNELCTIGIVEDGTQVTINKANEKHKYVVTLNIKENLNKEEGTAYKKPTRIANWSLGILNNDITSILYVQIKGYPAYKGKQRTINISIQANICREIEKTSIVQYGKDVVLDKTKEIDCNTLGYSDFKLINNSEASINTENMPKYTDNGWYAITLNVKENTIPDSYEKCVTIGNTNFPKPLTPNIDDYNYKVTEYINDTYIPFYAWWKQTGHMIKREATMKISDINDTLSLIWPEVPYTGNQARNGKYDRDWKYVQNTGHDWFYPDTSNTSFIATKNGTTKERTAKITFSFYNNDGTNKVANINDTTITFVQNPLKSIDELGYVFERENDEPVIIYENDGNIDITIINIISHDRYWNVCDIEPIDNIDGITIKRTLIDSYGIKLTIVPSNHIYSNNYKEWNLTLKQKTPNGKGYTGKTILLNIQQAGYSFDVKVENSSSAYLDTTSGVASLSIVSFVTTRLGTRPVDAIINQNDYSWLSISFNSRTNTTATYSCKAVNINDDVKNMKTIVSVRQQNTNIYKYVYLYNKNRRATELDESWIDLYSDEESHEKSFWSIYNERVIPLSSHVKKWDSTNSSTDPSWVMSSIENDEEKSYKITIKTNSVLDGLVPMTDVIRINNGIWGIGSFRVTKHAFKFYTTSESETECIMYVSSHAGKLWSMYYVTSTMDSEDIDFDFVMNSNGINVTKSGNSITLLPYNDNDGNVMNTNYEATITQKKSNQIIHVKIYQITHEYENQFEYIW